jgi:hypothetical protein
MHLEDTVAVVMSQRGALAFSPGEEVSDVRGGSWVVRGNLDVLDARIEDGVFRSESYPDALARVWAALSCPTSGDVLLSAAPGCEFADWGGADHVGGGSHGSLHRSDSLGALVFAGVEPPRTARRPVVDPRRGRHGAPALPATLGRVSVEPALEAGRGARRRGPAPAGGRAVRRGGERPQAPRLAPRPAEAARAGRPRRAADRRPPARGPGRARQAPRLDPRRVHEGRDAVAGQLLREDEARRAAERDRAGDRQRRHGSGRRGVDGVPRRVDDGARLRRRVRQEGQRAVRLDPAADPVRAAVPPAPGLSVLHLDLLVLCAFSVSLALFNAAEIETSVPIVAPLLAYLLGRMLWIGAAGGGREPLLRPSSWSPWAGSPWASSSSPASGSG